MRGLDILKRELDPKAPGFTGWRVALIPVFSYTATNELRFNRCLPACPPNIPAWDSCDQRGVAADRRRFWTEFDGLVATDELTKASMGQGETPLAETIGKAVRTGKPDKLVVFSDFLEYHKGGEGVPAVNFYTQKEDEMRRYFGALRNAQHFPRLLKVDVIGFGMGSEIGGSSTVTPRGGITDARWRSIYKSWVSYFQDAGARGFRLDREYPGATPPAAAPPPPPDDRPPTR